MGPRLAALVLLLLTLCRLSSASWSYVYAQNSYSHLLEEFVDKFAIGTNPDRLADLSGSIGNSLHALLLHSAGHYDKLPSYYKSALDNGVLCEATTFDESTIESALYRNETVPEDQYSKEEKVAKYLLIDIDCNSSSPDQCFCEEKKLLLYCAILRLKANITADNKTCIRPLLAEHGNLEIKNLLINEESLKLAASNTTDVVSMTSGHKFKNIAEAYCDTMRPKMDNIIESFHAADALFWTLDGIVAEAAFNKAHEDHEKACAVEKFKTSEIGKCACTDAMKGISYCIYKVRAELFQKEGYLVCKEGENKFDKAKAPARFPPFVCLSDSVAASSAACAEFTTTTAGPLRPAPQHKSATDAPTTAAAPTDAAPKIAESTTEAPTTAGLATDTTHQELDKPIELADGLRMDGNSVYFDPQYMSIYAKVYTIGAAVWVVFLVAMQVLLIFAKDPREQRDDKGQTESARMLLRHHETNRDSSSNRETEMERSHTQQTATEEPSRKTERSQEYSGTQQ